jgi:hypothetical protein
MNGLNTQSLLLSFAAAIVAVTLDPVASVAQESSTVLSAKALAEIAQVDSDRGVTSRPGLGSRKFL